MIRQPTPEPAAPARRPLTRAARICRRLLAVLYVAVALLGIVITPPEQIFAVAPVLGLLAIGSAVIIVTGRRQRTPSVPALAVTGLAAAGFVPFVVAIAVLGPVGALAVGMMSVLGLVIAADWFTRHRRMGPPAPGDAPAREVETSLRELLRTAPMPVLFSEWRASGRQLARRDDPDRLAAAAGLRALLLEEMDRRDPVGVERWLSEGGSDDPERYVRDDRGLAV